MTKLEKHPLKKVLEENGVKLWQLVRRFDGLGVPMREPQLSRILNGIEQPKPKVEEVLQRILMQTNWGGIEKPLTLEQRIEKLEKQMQISN